MNPDSLKVRTKQYAVRVVRLVQALPCSTPGRTIGNQLIRSGTSVAANYRASCRARSRAEFIAKIGVVIEEADESAFWLEMIVDIGLMKPKSVVSLLAESNELIAIFVASSKTARFNKK
jgi:four helix bundle protein